MYVDLATQVGSFKCFCLITNCGMFTDLVKQCLMHAKPYKLGTSTKCYAWRRRGKLGKPGICYQSFHPYPLAFCLS